MADKKNTYTIYDDGKCGSVIISDQVLCTIAGLAAVEVEGIASMKGDIVASQITRSAMNSLSKCARIKVEEGVISVQLVLNIRYGYNLPETTREVQEKVKDTLESMTGLKVGSVNISISDVKIDKTQKIKKPRKIEEVEEEE
jgi:uncharacterized alkaline shock family protein YloU